MKAETISDLQGGVSSGKLLAGEIVNVVGAKGRTLLDITYTNNYSIYMTKIVSH